MAILQDIASKSRYVHIQGVASDTWPISHNLNAFPNVVVVDSANTVVIPDVEYVDENNVIISFAAAFVGRAFFS